MESLHVSGRGSARKHLEIHAGVNLGNWCIWLVLLKINLLRCSTVTCHDAGQMSRCTVKCHDARSNVTMHGHMSRCTVTCHDARSNVMMHGQMSRCTVKCHDARSHVTMHGNMSRCTVTCHDARSHERKIP
jgi:hypothetical protein